MTDMKFFDRLRKELEKKDEVRECVIISSRPVIKSSKQAIYAIHRDELEKAKELLDKAGKDIETIKKLQRPEINAFGAALQEYAEAMTYYYFVKEDRLITDKEIEVDAENYLLGVCDLTGELGRKAVFSVVDNKTEEVKKIQEFVSQIYNEFLKFSFRNSELRKKSDSIKWNLKKIEEIMYDLKIRRK